MRDARRTAGDDLRNGHASYATANERILEAILAVAEADTEDDRQYHAAMMRHRKTLLDLGWRPPIKRQSRPTPAEQLAIRLPYRKPEAR